MLSRTAKRTNILVSDYFPLHCNQQEAQCSVFLFFCFWCGYFIEQETVGEQGDFQTKDG